jgi:hypothetical protein
MVETIVYEQEVNYGRFGLLKLVDNNVTFDTSDGEYGIVVLPITLLEEALKQHKMKQDEDLAH